MKITKLNKLNAEQVKKYTGQSNVTRNRESKGGYDNIIVATDQDLD